MISVSKCALVAVALAAGLGFATSSQAGPAQDALSECLVKSTTPADKVILVDWIFAVISLHPSVSNMASISDAQRETLNKNSGVLFTRLVSEDCGPELKAAVEKEGTDAVGEAFGKLGEMAMTDLMSDPKVQAGTEAMSTYIDQDKITTAVMGKPVK
jgi:hypothetical protein